jgi:hypothetical protein
MEQRNDLIAALKKAIPYAAAIALFAVITILYVNPIIEGKRLRQPDIVNWMGMAREVVEHREETGEEALWTNTMFSGMPAFQISVIHGNNISDHLHNVMTLWLPRPADMIFLYFAGFFIFLLMLKVNVWVALAGAIGFAFSSYHFIILEAGHNSKAVAIAYMAPVLASIIYAFRGNYLTGGVLFAIFMALQIFANHFQITYYLAIIVIFYGLFQLWEHYRQQRLKVFLKATVALVAGLVLAIGVNIGNFWSTYAYTSETMRGGTELTISEREVTSGLSREYITNWSYGIGETFTLLIPNAKGGGTQALGNSQRAMDAVEPAFRNVVAQQNHYWGDQPFTSGPVYVGAVVLFFFFLALFYVKGPLKWGLLLATILSIMLAWGKNFMPLTDFFIDYVPGYNKFRAVSMTLVIAELCIPALAFLGMHHLYHHPEKLSLKDKGFLTALGLTAGLALIFYLMPRTFFSFTSQMEAEFFAAQATTEPQMAAQFREILYNLENARVAIFRSDALRSFFFALAAGIAVLLLARKTIKPNIFVLIVTVLILADMVPINRRYLNDSHFAPKRQVENPFQPTQANLQILQDDDPHFRVFNRTVSTYNDASTSWFHFSIGGYHGAKLQRYQEIIDFHLDPQLGHVAAPNRNVLDMLNAKYFIVFGDEDRPVARRNPGALGNAWFVETYSFVENADEEILALYDLDPAVGAVVDRRFEEHLRGLDLQFDPEAQIWLTHYQPNVLRYRYQAATDQLAVFSEVFYPDGWEVTINGEPAEHFRANYILRAMVVPAGEHEIEFRFKPRTYYQGKNVALIFSILMGLAIVGAAGWSFYQRQQNTIHEAEIH